MGEGDGRLLPFPTFRVGAYSGWALIRAWLGAYSRLGA